MLAVNGSDKADCQVHCTFYAHKAEVRWDPKRKPARFGRRGLVGHADPKTGGVG